MACDATHRTLRSRHHDGYVYQGWEEYPSNLKGFDPWLENAEQYRQRLDVLSPALLSKKSIVDVVDADSRDSFVGHAVRLEGESDVLAHFERPLPHLQIVSICKVTSIRELRISKDVLCKLLTRHDIRPIFLDLLSGFRKSDELSEKGFGLWSAWCTRQGYEICYQLRYVEPVVREHQPDRKWTERQVGVYHRFEIGPKGKSIMIMLHPMENSRLQRRIEQGFGLGQYHQEFPASFLRLHLMGFSTYFDEWRWCLDDLGLRCLKLENEIFTAELGTKGDQSLNFDSLQKLRNMGSNLLTWTTMIRATVTILNGLRDIAHAAEEEASSRADVEDGSIRKWGSPELRSISEYVRKGEAFLSSVEVMQSRCDELIQLLVDGLNQKNQGISVQISNFLLELTRETVEISTSLLSLTLRTVSDSATVRVVTIITLIYLPTQFVATLFGTNFFGFGADEHLHASYDIWIFAAFAVPLTGLTLGIWKWATRKERQEKEKKQERLDG